MLVYWLLWFELCPPTKWYYSLKAQGAPDSMTLWTAVCQAPLSMGFSRQEYWSGLPFPPPGDLPDPGIEPVSLKSPVLAGRFFTAQERDFIWKQSFRMITWSTGPLIQFIYIFDHATCQNFSSLTRDWTHALSSEKCNALTTGPPGKIPPLIQFDRYPYKKMKFGCRNTNMWRWRCKTRKVIHRQVKDQHRWPADHQNEGRGEDRLSLTASDRANPTNTSISAS